jgi:hypothetical protein
MKSYWAISALLVFLSIPVLADDKQQAVATIGTGTFSCDKFTKYDAAPNNSGQMNLIIQWAWGFMSAYNLRAAFSATFQESDAPSPVSPPDATATLAFLREYCQRNPQSNVTSATLALIGRSGGIVTSSVNLR